MTPTRGSYAKGLAKRDEILDIALTVFAKNGYDHTSMREIARQAGLTQAGLLHHFSTKNELFLEVLRRRDGRSSGPTPSKPRRPIDRLINAVQTNTHEPGLVRLFVSMSAESTEQHGAGHTFFSERYRRLRSEIADDLSARPTTGGAADRSDAGDLATIMIAVADGLQVQWLLDPDGVDMERLLTLLWNRIRPAG